MAFVIVIGICQALTTTPSLELDKLPQWLGGAIAITGFLTFLVLVGPFGNFLATIVLFFVAWRAWHWPLWRAALLVAPFGYVTYQLIPKPWQGP